MVITSVKLSRVTTGPAHFDRGVGKLYFLVLNESQLVENPLFIKKKNCDKANCTLLDVVYGFHIFHLYLYISNHLPFNFSNNDNLRKCYKSGFG